MIEIVRCPKTGRILRLRGSCGFGRTIALTVGAFALVWVLVRVMPKPTRATYPCVRVATPLAASLLTYVASVGVVTAIGRKAAGLVQQARYAMAALALLAAGLVAVSGASISAEEVSAENVTAFTPTDAANAPIGVARGLKPGRVTWAYDQTATNFTGTGSYADDANTDKVKVRAMIERAVCVLTDKAVVADAWTALFTHFNNTQGGGSVSYQAGEKVAIKINLNNNGGATAIDASPQSAHALLWELVNVVGVAQADISIYDTMRRSAMGRVKTACQADFPNVHYNDGTTVAAITFSGGGITTKNIGTEAANAKYLFNMALLKRHGRPDPNWVDSMGNTAVTLTFKNHCGTVDNCSSLHNELRDWNQPFGSYNPLVDLMASNKVGKKTLLYLLDGLYSGNLWNSAPQKWQLVPFSGDYPSSIFASQDPVAIDSVGLDFLRSEWELITNADNYLHEAALIGAAPSGTVYKPDGTAVTQSLGVHEHWNSSVNKQYSRNLDPVNGKGIELVRAEGYVYGGGSTGGIAAGGGATGGATSASTGGRASSGGASGSSSGGVPVTTGGTATTSTGGRTGTGGVAVNSAIGGAEVGVGGAVASNSGGATANGGATVSSLGGATANSGASMAVGGAGPANGGAASSVGGATSSTAGVTSTTGDAADSVGGCSCRTSKPRTGTVTWLALVGLALLLRKRCKGRYFDRGFG